MRRLRAAVLLAGAVLLATTGVASATSHGDIPAGLSFANTAVWEIQHFAIHMSLALQAMQTWFVSPGLGWALLGEQALCASITPFTGLLFGSAWGALATFLLTTTLGVMLTVWLTFTFWRIVTQMPARPTVALAT